MFLYILIFKFLDRGEDKEFWIDGSKHSPNLIYSQFLRECNFDWLLSFPGIASYRRNLHSVLFGRKSCLFVYGYASALQHEAFRFTYYQ